MPYKVMKGQGCPDGKPFAVVKETDGTRMGCHDTNESAMAQMRALYAQENMPMNDMIRTAAKKRK